MANNLITDPEEIRELYKFIKSRPLGYPDYLIWVEKCFRELQIGEKKAVAYRVNGKIVANLVFQRHKEDGRLLELKNGRVDEAYMGRGIFAELLRETESYARDNGFLRIICDTHDENVTQVFQALGYRIECRESLYEPGMLETILVKDIE